MAVQQCHVLVLHRHWMVVGSRWLPTVILTLLPTYAIWVQITQLGQCSGAKNILEFEANRPTGCNCT
jgi:hypothetical protein